MRVLWIGRIVPAASTSGDRVYSRGLATALAHAGAEVVAVGLGDPEASPADVAALDPAVRWVVAPGEAAPALPSLFSLQPLVVRRHATAPARRLLREVLAQARFDVVVFDNYAAAWALPHVRRAAPGAALVHVAHNHEAALARAIARDSRASWPRRFALGLNALKIARAERRLAKASALVVTLTDEDAQVFRREAPAAEALTLPPGHPGAGDARPRMLAASVPRRVLLLGSYRWEAKQMNLRALLDAADGRFAEAGVRLDVVGEVPAGLRRELEARCRAATFHGFVADPAPLLASARLGVVPEATGGGFKLKTLDYVFAGLPVAAIAAALAGLPEAVRASAIAAPDMDGLVDAILAAVDDPSRLDRLQRQAMAAAATVFSWEAAGRRLQAALCGLTKNSQSLSRVDD